MILSYPQLCKRERNETEDRKKEDTKRVSFPDLGFVFSLSLCLQIFEVNREFSFGGGRSYFGSVTPFGQLWVREREEREMRETDRYDRDRSQNFNKKETEID